MYCYRSAMAVICRWHRHEKKRCQRPVTECIWDRNNRRELKAGSGVKRNQSLCRSWQLHNIECESKIIFNLNPEAECGVHQMVMAMRENVVGRVVISIYDNHLLLRYLDSASIVVLYEGHFDQTRGWMTPYLEMLGRKWKLEWTFSTNVCGYFWTSKATPRAPVALESFNLLSSLL